MKKLEDDDLRDSFAKIHKKAREDMEKSAKLAENKDLTEEQRGSENKIKI